MEDSTYYCRRAQTERELSHKAATPEIAALHLKLANEYDALLANPSARPALRVVTEDLGPRESS